MNKKLFTVILAFLIMNTAVFGATITVEQKRATVSEKLKRLKVLENQEKSKLVKNQKKLESATTTLEVSQTEFNSLDSQLKRLERDYSNMFNEYNAANNQLAQRVRKVFKTQRIGMFQLILSASDLNTFLDVIYFEKLVLKRDADRMLRLKSQARSLSAMKRNIEAKRSNLAQSIEHISTQKKVISKAIVQNQNMISKLKTDRVYYERTERELARQSESIQNMISRNRGGTVTVSSSGSFSRPITGRISSPFGWRTHPIFNSRTFHSGVDIAGPNLGSIRASNAGKVIFAGWYGGYGKVVILDHGNVSGKPITTLYAHMSSTKVTEGQYVNKGDVIGYEGTTGYSTGPHCHFEVRVEGKPNDPMHYI